MSWTLEKDFRFEAAHHLPFHDGKCKRIHGHSWRGKVVVRGEGLQSSGPQMGMVLDYGIIGRELKILVDEYLDHWDLNETVAENPTSEVVAEWVYQKMLPHIPFPAVLVAVEIEETCTARCRYEPPV